MLTKPRGTRDMLPKEMEARRETERQMREQAQRWGYREISTPAFEELELFTLRSGEGIIDEMYAFEDKGGRKLSLRPELTAPVLRCYVNEGRSLSKPVKWCYFADCFRYERPQKGRYRQFWQFGVELIGADSAMADAEVIMVADSVLASTGVNYSLQIGDLSLMRSLLKDLSPKYQKQVRTYLDKRDADGAAEFLRETGHEELINALNQLINAKTPDEIFEVVGEIPEKERIKEMFEILDSQGIKYEINPAIARGLDYYTGMVFEGFAEGLGAENQIIGGGAYRLAHLFGGEDTPSAGFAIGFDRVMVALGETKATTQKRAYVVATQEYHLRALEVASKLRDAGIITETDIMQRGFGSQMKTASKKADFAVIIGKRELESGNVTVKNLETGEQQAVELKESVQIILKN